MLFAAEHLGADSRSAEAATLRVQSVLYNNRPEDIAMTLASLARASELALASGGFRSVEVAVGDCSDEPRLSDDFLREMRAAHPQIAGIDYNHFGENIGSAGGHNRLLTSAGTDFILVMNPDVRIAPRTIVQLAAPFASPNTGIAEARQLPVEHPKDYDVVSGVTSWASTACAMIPLRTLRALRGFDAANFFLYCDDVDFSWRVRLLGMKVIFEPSAVAFHDKRLSVSGGWVASEPERYYSAEASLLLTWKWSRADLCRHYLAQFEASDDPHMRRAALEFRRREAAGLLPASLDPNQRVAQFVGINYAKHRYVL
jgi:GT2 family glycosyltransferase